MKKLTAEKCRNKIEHFREVSKTWQLSIEAEYTLQALEIALPILEQQERGDGWIKWGGGEQPVGDDVTVEMKWDNGAVMCGKASEYRWYHDSLLSDVNLIAYRIIPEQTTNQNGEQ